VTSPEEETPEEESESVSGYSSIHQALNFMADNAEEMMEYQHLITKVCTLQANNWIEVAKAFQLQHRRALANAEACAWIGRKSAENVGDIITASYGLDDDEMYQADGPEDDDDES